MDFFAFERTLLRLKESLGVQTDKDVAAALEMDVSALNKRKARGSFPEDKLLALKARRPDLNLDVGYVLTGRTTKEIDAAIAGIGGRLREVRGTRSVEEFAAQFGLEPRDLEQIESGAAWPDGELVQAVIQTNSGVDITWLVTGQRPQATGELSQVEKVLVANYRSADARGKWAIRRVVALLAQPDQGAEEG